MLNLMKYELIKQRTSKIILGGVLLLLEIGFFIALILENVEMMAFVVTFFMLLVTVTFFIVALEAINTYYHDLRDKSGYMLFMTPNSVYTIMASKILTSILTIIVVTIIFGLVVFMDFTIVCVKYGELERIIEQAREALRMFWSIDINIQSIITEVIMCVFGWISILTSAFLAITLCMTLMAGVKGKGLISFILFWIINIAYNIMTERILTFFSVSDYMIYMGISTAFVVVFAVLCFWFSGYMLNKELSL